MYWLFHIVCVVYCLYKSYKSYAKTSNDGVIGTTPALDTLMIMFLAPILAVVDVSLTWIRLYREAYEVKKNRNKVF